MSGKNKVELVDIDFLGQERFANMTRVYYRDSHGAIIVGIRIFLNDIITRLMIHLHLFI